MSIESGENPHQSKTEQAVIAQPTVEQPSVEEAHIAQKNSQKSSFLKKIVGPLAAVGILGGGGPSVGQGHVEDAQFQSPDPGLTTQSVEPVTQETHQYEQALHAHDSALRQSGTPPEVRGDFSQNTQESATPPPVKKDREEGDVSASLSEQGGQSPQSEGVVSMSDEVQKDSSAIENVVTETPVLEPTVMSDSAEQRQIEDTQKETTPMATLEENDAHIYKVTVPGVTKDGNVGTNEAVDSPEAEKEEVILFDTLEQGINGGVTKQEMSVISTQAGWDQVKAELVNRNKDQKLSDVDFEKNFIIAVFNGWDFTQHSMIEVTGVTEHEDHYEVNVLDVNPEFNESNHPYEKDPSSPYHLVRVLGEYDPEKPVKFNVTVDTNYYDLKEIQAVNYDREGNKTYSPSYVEKIPLPEEDEQAVLFKEIAQDNKSNIDFAGKLFVSDQDALNSLWSKLGREDEVPEIDFVHNTVLFFTRGPYETGGNTIVKRVYEEDQSINVMVEMQTSHPDTESQNKGSYSLIQWEKGPIINEAGSDGKKINVVMYETMTPDVPASETN